ncbi:MAG: flagellar hook-associated protein FlgL [Gammaproteobacteria bacterium]
MRISTAWSHQLGVNAMLTQQTKLSKTQMQLSTGLKNLMPSDDPAAAARVLDLQEAIDKTQQYQDNIFTTRARLNIEETALDTSENILFRVKELTIQAQNDTLNASDRVAIKQEVDQMIEQLAGVANTKNANGEFIFSGDLSSVPAFVLNPETGTYVYQGGMHQRALQIGPERQVADGDTGFKVFENIPSVSLDQNEDGKRSIFNTLKALSESLNGEFNAVPAAITGTRFLRYGLDYSATGNGPTTFNLVTDGGVTAEITLNSQFSDLESIVTEINAQIANNPLPVAGSDLSGSIQARSNGNRIEFVSKTAGSGSSIQIDSISGSFLQDAGFTDGQSHVGVDLPADNVFHKQLDDVLTDLDSALDSFLHARTSVGARLRALDDQESLNDKFVIDAQEALSKTQDLDYAEAISRFNLQQISLQAAQQAFAKVQNLSLFNYL